MANRGFTTRGLVTLATLIALVLALALPATAFGQAAGSPCPPGQPNGRPPGVPPNQPGPPNGRPPNYPPGQCALALSRSAGERGQTVQATGSGFVPGETVAFSLAGRRVAEAVADPAGSVSATLTIPNDAPIGQTEVRATGAQTQLAASFEVLATSADTSRSATRTAAAAAGTLSRTGDDIAQLTTLGLVLLVTGAAIVIAVRRRRTISPHEAS